MTKHIARLYVLVAGVLTFFLAWAGVAAHPWAPTAAQDPRIAALAARQQRIHLQSVRVQKIVNARWSSYRGALASRNLTAKAPSVRVVNLPPLVVTKTS
jgi:hypothetical protein